MISDKFFVLFSDKHYCMFVQTNISARVDDFFDKFLYFCHDKHYCMFLQTNISVCKVPKMPAQLG